MLSCGNPKVRDHLQDLGADGTVTLQRMLTKYGVDCIHLDQNRRQLGGSGKHGNYNSGFIKLMENFLLAGDLPAS